MKGELKVVRQLETWYFECQSEDRGLDLGDTESVDEALPKLGLPVDYSVK